MSSNNLYISNSKTPKAGRGVFSKSKIKKGNIIESCPIVEIPKEELDVIEKSILINYVYFFGKNKEKILLALGFGSIYNHSYTPNALYKIKPKEKVIEFIALYDIQKNEEITVNYNQKSPNSAPLWFE